jgi:hypothetical protein
MATHRQWYALEVYASTGDGFRTVLNYLFAGLLDETGPDTTAGLWEWVASTGGAPYGWRPLAWQALDEATRGVMADVVRGLVGRSTSERLKVAHPAFPTTQPTTPGAYPHPYLVEGVLVATERPYSNGTLDIYVPTNSPGAPTPGNAYGPALGDG